MDSGGLTYLFTGVVLGAAVAAPVAALLLRGRGTEAESLKLELREAQVRAEAQAREVAKMDAYIEACDDALDRAFGEATARALKDLGDQAQLQAERRARGEKEAIEGLLGPMKAELAGLEKLTREVEEARVKAEGALDERLRRIQETSDNLAGALKKPQVRGAWGESQLVQILESSGMTEGTHYLLQDHTDEEGEALRTDVVILLPRGRRIVVDSKAPLDHYWAAMNAGSDEERGHRAKAHVGSVRAHLRTLKSKDYWKRYPGSPDYVILFLPYEGAYQLACEHDKGLLNDCRAQKVILANPMTLMNLVHVAAFALQEERLHENTEEIRAHGQRLCDRLRTMLEHVEAHGAHLRLAIGSYNDVVGSATKNLIPAARRMKDLGAGADRPLPELKERDDEVRHLVVPAFLPAESDLPVAKS